MRARLLAGFKSYLALRSAGILLGYAAQVFVSRWMGKQEYGYYSLLTTAAFVLGYVAALGFPTSMERFLPQYIVDGRWGKFKGLIRYSTTRMLWASAAMAVPMGAVLAWYPHWSNLEKLAAVAAMILIPVQSAQEIFEGGLTAEKRWMDSFVPSLVVAPVAFILGVVALDQVIGQLHLMHVMVVLVVVNALTTLLQGVLLIRSLPPEARGATPDYSDRGPWVATSIPVLVMIMFGVLQARADLFAVGYFLGHAHAGVYAAVLATTDVLGTFAKASSTVVTPEIAPLLHEGRIARLQWLISDAALLATRPTVVLAILLTFIGDDLL
ncbi:MAG: hypothetical protein AB1758_35680, partial [Candidatus Eremiobacterota bacterium]